MKYHLSLPAGWKAGGTWPVAVLIPDASRDFEGNLAAFVKARGPRPYVLVAPHVVTSGGSGYRQADTYRYSEADWKKVTESGDFRFDEEGIAAVLADVRKDFGGEEKVFLTGWEAGGHTVWALLFRHPEWFRAVAPVSTNYLGRWLDASAFSTSPARATLPVRVLFCEQAAAPQGWNYFTAQTKNALKAAADHGFTRVSLVEVPGKPHGPMAYDVLAFFESSR
jgi:dienelactone hydrolase